MQIGVNVVGPTGSTVTVYNFDFSCPLVQYDCYPFTDQKSWGNLLSEQTHCHHHPL